MSFEHDPTDGATLYGPNGEVVWSSARRQAYWTDYVTGSFTITAMPGTGNANFVAQITTLNLSPVAAHATHIMGSFTATQSGGYSTGGVANGGIHQLGGTTMLMVATYLLYPSVNTGSSESSDIRYSTWVSGAREDVSAAIILSTYVEGGWLKADVERSKPVDGGGPASWAGLGNNTITIAYQGLAFTFDN